MPSTSENAGGHSAYEGAELRITVAGRNGAAPTAEVEGLDVPSNAKGRTVRLGPFTATATGLLTLRVGGPARVKWSMRVK